MADVESVRDQARVAIAQGNYEKALSLLETIRRFFPQDVEARTLVGQIHLENRRPKAAKKAFEDVLEVDPENVIARCGLAVLAQRRGDLEEALAQFRRAFDINSSNQPVASQIKRIQSRLGRGKGDALGTSSHAEARRFLREDKANKAIPLLRSALRATHYPEIAVGLIQATWLDKQWKQAGVAAREVLATRPRCLKAMAVLAGIHLLKGEAQWQPLLKETGALDPGNGVARRLFVKVSLAFPDLEDSADIPDAELEDPSEALLRRERALAESRAALRADASTAPRIGETLRGMVESDPADLEARWLLGDALALQGRFKPALEEYLVVLRKHREAPGEGKS